MGGSTVTITGTGLDGATVVRFGGAAGTITADSATQITVTSPPSAGTAGGTGAGIVDVTVTTPGGTSHHAAADHYAYTAPPPAITGVSPPSGGTAGGTTVTITGTGLAGATAVRFGAAAATITADSATQITVTSPPGTGRVDITVTTPAGTSPASQGNYSYAANPKPAQSITFAVPAAAAAGGTAALSAAGGGSGNPVVFTVDPASGPGVCTVSGTTVTYTAIGTCIIDANQAGNGHYAAAPQIQRTITVSGLSQSISLSAPAAGYVRDSGHLIGRRRRLGQPGRADLRQRRRVHPVRDHRDLHRAGQLRRGRRTRPATGATRTRPRSGARSRSGRSPNRSPSSPRRRGPCGPRRSCRPPAAPPATPSCLLPPPPGSATCPEAR